MIFSTVRVSRVPFLTPSSPKLLFPKLLSPTRAPRLAFLWVVVLLATPVALAGQQPAQEQQEQYRHHTSHHRFADAERWSRQFDNPERDAWQKPQEVISLMELEPGMTAVDIGAGTGYFLGPLAAAVGSDGRVLGLDIEAAMVDFMNERAEREGWRNVAARRVEPDDPGLEAGSVDRVLIVNTWHHIGERSAYAASLHDSLAAGGRVYIVDFTLDSSHGPPRPQRLTAEEVASELAAGGLETAVLEESLPDQYIVVGRR